MTNTTVGSIDLDFRADTGVASANVRSFNKDLAATEQRVEGTARAFQRSSTNTRRASRNWAQAAFQAQDVAVQAQAGTNAFVILGQQGSQLLSVFGTSGALFGAVLAFGGLAGSFLVKELYKARVAAKDLERANEALGSSYDKLRSQVFSASFGLSGEAGLLQAEGSPALRGLEARNRAARQVRFLRGARRMCARASMTTIDRGAYLVQALGSLHQGLPAVLCSEMEARRGPNTIRTPGPRLPSICPSAYRG